MSALALPARRSAGMRALFAAPVAVLWLLFAAANVRAWGAAHAPLGLGAAALEAVVAVLFLLRRAPLTTSRSPLAWTAAVVGTFGMLGARPAYHPVGGLEPLFAALQIAGALVAVAAVVALGRSFGLVAANRGIRTHGPYRVVRHPLYAGYLLTETGYALENPSLRNWGLYVLVLGVQAVRIAAEERWLSAEPAYRSYCGRVRYRVLPYVL